MASELGVSKDTVRGAMALLEREGGLKASEAGKPREIVRRVRDGGGERKLRVAILLHEKLERDNAQTQELILSIKLRLESVGHICVIGEQSIVSLGNNVCRVAEMVKAMGADAWIVYAGTREVLEWFAGERIRVLAIGGRALGLPIAWTRSEVERAMGAAIRKLVGLGHRRIVLICSGLWRKPTTSLAALAFLEGLEASGVAVSSYNLPDWEETAEGFEELLNSLFFATPPSAMVVTEPSYAVALLIFLASRGIRVPRDVSLVSIIPDPGLCLVRPLAAHFEWPIPEHIERAFNWIEAVAMGREDRDVTVYHAKFRRGGTIAPVTGSGSD